jgi:hypothetical protein
MSPPPVPFRNADWLTARQACQQIGCSPTVVMRLALLGQIRTRLDPGTYPRYSAEDIARIVDDGRRKDGRSNPRPGGRRQPERAGV